MYFDFHTHAFADAIAQRAMSALLDTTAHSEATKDMIAYTDGTIGGLRSLMEKRGISSAMLLPIATKPSQQTTINSWAASVMGGGLYCCGTVHPDAEDAVAEVERIKQLGLYGLKFHSEYQRFRPDEERMMPIYRKAAELGLFVVFHGGWDPFGKDEILARPRCFANIADKLPELTIIAAHMGGIKLADEVEDCIIGKYGNIYLDTGVVADFLSSEQLLRMIQGHGTDRILFASDAPWDDPQKEIDMLNALPLTDEEKQLIFFKNAEKLINRYT